MQSDVTDDLDAVTFWPYGIDGSYYQTPKCQSAGAWCHLAAKQINVVGKYTRRFGTFLKLIGFGRSQRSADRTKLTAEAITSSTASAASCRSRLESQWETPKFDPPWSQN